MQQELTSGNDTLVLENVHQGQTILVVVTNADQDANMEFLHAADASWRVDPRFNGARSAGVIIQEIKAASASLRLKFAANVAQTVYVSVVQSFESTGA